MLAYSYLKASIGERLAALLAGATPKIKPTAVETPRANKTAVKVTLIGKIGCSAQAPK
jgi:hypothetical protein